HAAKGRAGRAARLRRGAQVLRDRALERCRGTHRQSPLTRAWRNSRPSVTRRYQVVIVGAGPVGAALALDLGLRGLSCALVESRTGLQRIPKGQNLTHRTLEHFHSWGIASELRDARVMPPGYAIGEITAYGSLAGRYWQAPAGREIVQPYYFQKNERLPQ